MANSKKVKRVHICPTCKGNGYIKIQNIYDVELQVHQCWDCDSEGGFIEYVTEDDNMLMTVFLSNCTKLKFDGFDPTIEQW